MTGYIALFLCVVSLACSTATSEPCIEGILQCRDHGREVCVGGEWVPDETCDVHQGLTCDPQTLTCSGSCLEAQSAQSYIGCDYYPTITGNDVADDFTFAVAVSNASEEAATVRIEGGDLFVPIEFEVAGGDVHIEPLPWNDDLKLCPRGWCYFDGPDHYAAHVPGGAFRLRSTQPITVYQFSPLQYTLGPEEFSFTNDASLLLPAHTWAQDYVVASWPRHDTENTDRVLYPGFIAITAQQDDTDVTITTTTDTPADNGVPGFTAGVPQTVRLNGGDVFEISAPGVYGNEPREDLTGSFVTSTKPIQVISGHFCTFIPSDVWACDHLEQSMLGISALSNRYQVTSAAMPPLPTGKEQYVRIIAAEDDTTIVFDPALPGVATHLAQRGDFAEVELYPGDFTVTADKKVLVAQYMSGQDVAGDMGDPSMVLAVPLEQYRRDYLFHAPTNYDTNYVNIVAPLGSTVTLDGESITDFTAIGGSEWGVVKYQLDNSGNGNHRASSSEAFGITVYGYGRYTSYYYPGGLDLDEVEIVID